MSNSVFLFFCIFGLISGPAICKDDAKFDFALQLNKIVVFWGEIDIYFHHKKKNAKNIAVWDIFFAEKLAQKIDLLTKNPEICRPCSFRRKWLDLLKNAAVNSTLNNKDESKLSSSKLWSSNHQRSVQNGKWSFKWSLDESDVSGWVGAKWPDSWVVAFLEDFWNFQPDFPGEIHDPIWQRRVFFKWVWWKTTN